MLIEIAIADSAARSFEFNTREFINKYGNDLTKYHHRDNEIITGIGTFTDDTQMTCACAEALLQDVLPLSQEDYAQWFVRVYERDPRGGYSRRVKGALEVSAKFTGELEWDVQYKKSRIF
ncbi:MAG TPA: ADP-ribosylglycohydrolase family protein, partial [Candidatus Hodarchaeales archaeon]|nr:ADP-ribosylglycohydrolase family protein [Candidatus Hodarchaeales archaeon]